MNNKFTVEEVNLICIFECKSRTKVISDIKKARGADYDKELQKNQKITRERE